MTEAATLPQPTPATAAAAKIPYIDPARCVVQFAGRAFKVMFVRLPKDVIADDLKRPELWKLLQAKHAKALRKFDQVIMASHDESWMAEAVVADAQADAVTLAKPKITTFPERYDALFQDPTYAVVWVGTGYAVRRKKDSHIMTQPVANPALAERDLKRLYPKPAA
jgi:hypothetical protein